MLFICCRNNDRSWSGSRECSERIRRRIVISLVFISVNFTIYWRVYHFVPYTSCPRVFLRQFFMSAKDSNFSTSKTSSKCLFIVFYNILAGIFICVRAKVKKIPKNSHSMATFLFLILNSYQDCGKVRLTIWWWRCLSFNDCLFFFFVFYVINRN